MAAALYGQWGKVLETLGSFKNTHEGAAKAALFSEAQFLRTQMVQGLNEQAPGGKSFKPLSETTIAIRKFLGFRGTKALIRHGDLRNSISVLKQDGAIFVGVRRTAKNKDGHSLYDLALIHEYGSKPIVIKITPKMAALLHMAFNKAGINRRDRVRAWRKGAHISTGIMVVQIPARPFIRPIIDQFCKPEDLERRLADRYAGFMRAAKGSSWEKI